MKCYGCGGEIEGNPIVGMIHIRDVAEGAPVMENPSPGSPFVGIFVCRECHGDPAHRTEHALKAHFMPAGGSALRGLAAAGSSDLG